MSTLKVNTIQDTTGNDALTIDSSGNVTASKGFIPSTQLSHRNLIINGDMQVAQRGTSATGVTTGGYHTVDRFTMGLSSLGTWTMTQSTDAPNGFNVSAKLTCTTADASPASGDVLYIQHIIEAQNLQSLSYGNLDAKELTLSFWVKSNKTGTATVSMLQSDSSNKLLSPTYTINSADTWEKKTISIPADTAGNFNNDNGAGLPIYWFLNSGSSYSSGTNRTTWSTYNVADRNASNLGVGGATSDYFAITGVQLEVGSVATPFEHRSYGEELARCQRYYWDGGTNKNYWMYDISDHGNSSGYRRGNVYLPVTMRAYPTVTTSINFSSGSYTSGVDSGDWTDPNHISLFANQVASGVYAYARNISADAEL